MVRHTCWRPHVFDGTHETFDDGRPAYLFFDFAYQCMFCSLTSGNVPSR